MATQLKRLWTFLNTDIRELGKSGEIAETGAEVSKAVLEFAIALGLLAAVPAAPIAAAGLSFVGIARKGVKAVSGKDESRAIARGMGSDRISSRLSGKLQ
jgi:hypothetical protein